LINADDCEKCGGYGERNCLDCQEDDCSNLQCSYKCNCRIEHFRAFVWGDEENRRLAEQVDQYIANVHSGES